MSLNKYKSEMTTWPKNNNLDNLIDPTFGDINRLFVLSFKNGDDDPSRNSFDDCYFPLVKIKDFNALISDKSFFGSTGKKKQQAYEKPVKMSRNDDYTTWNFLDYPYHQSYYKLIDIGLSKQTNTTIPQEVNFPRKLEENDGATMFFITEKHQKTILHFSLDSLIVTK